MQAPAGFKQYDPNSFANTASSYSQAQQASSQYGGVGGMSGGGNLAMGDPSHQHRRGEVGGGWGNAGASHSVPGVVSASGAFNPSSSRSSSKSNGEYEGRLVDSITAPSGVRPIPTKDEMTKFLTQCESLDKWLVSSILNARLTDDYPWQSQMKALCVFESLLDQPNKQDVEDFICENIQNIERLENSTNPQLKKKAIRVLELCDLRETEKKAPTATPASASVHYQPANGHVSAPGGVTDMFGSLNINEQKAQDLFALPGEEKATAPGGAPGGFSFMGDSHHPPAPLAPVPTKPRSFDPLEANSPPPPVTPQPQQQRSHAPPTLDSLLDNTPSSSGQKVDPFTLLMTNSKGTAPASARPPTNPGLPGSYPPNPAFPGYPPPSAGYPGYPPPPAGYGYPPQGHYGAPPFTQPGAVDFTVKSAAPKPGAPGAPQPAGQQSGFGFIGGGGGGGDSFNFVGDLMK